MGNLNYKRELKELITKATPKQLSLLIEMLEQDQKHDLDDFLLPLKVFALSELLKKLNIKRCILDRTGRGFDTYLHIDADTGMLLVISKKDSQDVDSTYARLYDMHKDELLQIMSHKSLDTEAV